MHNKDCTCWNCPAIDLVGKVDFRACGQSVEEFRKKMELEDSSQVWLNAKEGLN